MITIIIWAIAGILTLCSYRVSKLVYALTWLTLMLQLTMRLT